MGAAARSSGAQETVVRHNFVPFPPGYPPTHREEVLALLLDRSADRYGPARMVFVEPLTQSRAFRELHAGQIDILGTGWTPERDGWALPIRVDLYRGMMGLRTAVGLPARIAQIGSASDWRDIQRWSLGVGQEWPCHDAYKAAGLNVVRMLHVGPAVERVRRGDLDLISQSVVEASWFAPMKGLSVIPSWGMFTDEPYYFFVSPDRPELAERLRYGFRRAGADGSLDALFGRRVQAPVARWLEQQPVIYDLREGRKRVDGRAFASRVLTPLMHQPWAEPR
jgi:ABC-type amino acid transport substrate-binding protein